MSGHFHRVAPESDGISGVTHETDVINGVNYHNFKGAVLGDSASDLRGNTVFVVTIDTDLGVTEIKPFEYSNSARDRYNPLDIDNIMGTNQRRSRY